jgi:predicted nucleotidyltransferase
MPAPNLGALRAVADRLDELKLNYAFVGGSIVNLLLDDPNFLPARPTDDVDVVLEVVTTERYSAVEERIRRLGFEHDTREGASLCRWVLGHITVDIMPTDGAHLGLNTAWFKEALATATEREISHTRLKLVSAAGFLATKYIAFLDRGQSDYYASQDLEDFVTVVDGRENIVADINLAPEEMRRFLIDAARTLTSTAEFDEALPGQLSPDSASQQRLPKLRTKLREIAALP